MRSPMAPRSVSIFCGAVLLALCAWHFKAPARGPVLYLLPMTPDLTWRPLPSTGAWPGTRAGAPSAQLAPAPTRTRSPGIFKAPARKRTKSDTGGGGGDGDSRGKRDPTPKPVKVEKAIGPPHRVILLGDEGYDQSIVVSTVRSVVPDVNAQQAMDVFNSAQKNGQEEIITVPEEDAKDYVRKLTHSIPIVYAVAEKVEKESPDSE